MRLCFVLIIGMLASVMPISAALFGGSEAYLEKEEGARGLGALFSGAEDTSAAQRFSQFTISNKTTLKLAFEIFKIFSIKMGDRLWPWIIPFL
ncbi:MAG: hypothetical protein ACJZ86_04840 [Pontiellaceae bacterium]